MNLCTVCDDDELHVGLLCAHDLREMHDLNLSVHADVAAAVTGPDVSVDALNDAIVTYARATGRLGALGLPETAPAGTHSQFMVELVIASWWYNEGFDVVSVPLARVHVATRAEAAELDSWVAQRAARGWALPRRTKDPVEVKVREAHPGHQVVGVSDAKLIMEHAAAYWPGY